MKIKILDFIEPSRMRVQALSEDVTLDSSKRCPACLSDLNPLVIFCGYRTSQKIRFGLCDNCGYMGYMDRPSKEWLVYFYKGTWDKWFTKSIDQIKNQTDLPKEGVKGSRHLALSLVERMPDLDRNRPVCEIGCGYGEVLHNLSRMGFSNIVGVENSQHRADLVNRALGFRTLSGNFEGDEVQQELSKIKPIGLFFSHHVLEHVYFPDEVIAKASALQNDGDYLILSLPNGAGEHIGYGLFYLLHLHAFTKESLEIMLNKNHYEIIADKSPDETNIIIAAKKVAHHPVARFNTSGDYRWRAINRIKRFMAASSFLGNKKRKIVWRQKVGFRDNLVYVKRADSLGLFEKALVWIKKMLRKFSNNHVLLVGPVQNDSDRSSILEFWFKDKINFLIK